MARKWRSGLQKFEKDTESREEASLLGKLLSFICRGPFPINALGLVLRRLPSPWNEYALLIILVAIGILIVHPLVSPVQDFSFWLYYRVIPGPSVLVNFNNTTGEIASISKDFKFWISENQNDNQDNAINDIRAMPDGAIMIPPDTQEAVRIPLGRDREIHRLYRGGGYLRLRFDVNGTDIEIGDDCNKVISNGLMLVISDPSKWTSRPIALWFSEMEDSKTNDVNLPSHVFKATRMIVDSLDVFEILAVDPNKHDPNRIVLNIMVGCYRTEDPTEKNKLILEIEENGGKLKNIKITESYKGIDKFEDAEFKKRIISRLRKNILDRYPPRGIINGLQSKELRSEENEPLRESALNIGRITGIQRGDVFYVLPVNQDKVIGKAQVVHVMEQESSANLISDSEEVKKGCRIKWINERE